MIDLPIRFIRLSPAGCGVFLIAAVLLTAVPQEAAAQVFQLPGLNRQANQDRAGEGDQAAGDQTGQPQVPQPQTGQVPEEQRGTGTEGQIEQQQQPEGPPVWLSLEEAKRHFAEGTYGSALRRFRDILERDPDNANAHLWIGHVFFAEGQYGAAEEKYRDAIRFEDNFYPYGLRFEALYSLAELARLQGKDEEFGAVMRQIIEEGSANPLSEQRRGAMLRTFLEQGPDKLLELYRMREKRVRYAYASLGLHAFEQQEYEAAVEHLMLSTCISLSLAIETVRREEFDYSFIQEELPVGETVFSVQNTRRFLQNARQRQYLSDYFNGISFYREIFVLGAALYGADYREEAQSMWLLAAEHREAGMWSTLAREQLANPDLQAVPNVFSR